MTTCSGQDYRAVGQLNSLRLFCLAMSCAKCLLVAKTMLAMSQAMQLTQFIVSRVGFGQIKSPF